jgi:hypothetical protein
VDLLLSQVKNSIRDLLEAKGIRARVLDKVNARGEVVIAAIVSRSSLGAMTARDAELIQRVRQRGQLTRDELDEITDVETLKAIVLEMLKRDAP